MEGAKRSLPRGEQRPGAMGPCESPAQPWKAEGRKEGLCSAQCKAGGAGKGEWDAPL